MRKSHNFNQQRFNDMYAERDYLVKDVFPELRNGVKSVSIR